MRILTWSCAGLLGMVAMAVSFVLHSLHQVPEFYRQAVEQDEEAQTEANDECLRGAARLASDVQRPGSWQALFTAEQINGWLAVDLNQNYPDALPAELENPRIAFRNKQATLACTFREGDRSTVVSISFDLYLSAPNIVALRIRGVRAGLLPVPLNSVLDGIATAARKFELELEWRQAHGDPVALVRVPTVLDESSRELRLDIIEVRDDGLYLSGETIEPGTPEIVQSEPTEDEPVSPMAEADAPVRQAQSESDTNENVQR